MRTLQILQIGNKYYLAFLDLQHALIKLSKGDKLKITLDTKIDALLTRLAEQPTA